MVEGQRREGGGRGTEGQFFFILANLACFTGQKEYRLFANATPGKGLRSGVDKLKRSGATASAINKTPCRRDEARVYRKGIKKRCDFHRKLIVT